MTFNKRMIASGRGDWETDPEFFATVDQVFHFQVDVCADGRNRKCETWIGKEQDGLKTPWSRPIPFHGGFYRGWMNPEYSQAMAWTTKAAEEYETGFHTVALLPARTDPEWFHGPVQSATAILFLKKRLRFYLPCVFCGASTYLLRKPNGSLKMWLDESLPTWQAEWRMEKYPVCHTCGEKIVPEWDRERPIGWDFLPPANSPSFPSMLVMWVPYDGYDIWQLGHLGAWFFPGSKPE